jgi:hypothetical protein
MRHAVHRSWRLANLTPAHRRCLLRGVGAACLARTALGLLPYPSAQRLLSLLGRPYFASEQLALAEVAAWARASSRVITGGRPCLPRAHAAQLLLAWYGHPARVCFGVARQPSGTIVAHAWVEAGGQVVAGSRAGYRTLEQGSQSAPDRVP